MWMILCFITVNKREFEAPPTTFQVVNNMFGQFTGLFMRFSIWEGGENPMTPSGSTTALSTLLNDLNLIMLAWTTTDRRSRDGDLMLFYCWASVADCVPTLDHHWLNVLNLPGSDRWSNAAARAGRKVSSSSTSSWPEMGCVNWSVITPKLRRSRSDDRSEWRWASRRFASLHHTGKKHRKPRWRTARQDVPTSLLRVWSRHHPSKRHTLLE